MPKPASQAETQPIIASGTPTTAPIIGQHIGAAWTATDANTAKASLQTRFQVANGAAVDFTIRLALGQLVPGARAGTPPLPPVGTPGLSARMPDVLTLAVPDGIYVIGAMGGTVDAAGTTHVGAAATVDGRLPIAWPASAIAAGERHLRHITLRRIA